MFQCLRVTKVFDKGTRNKQKDVYTSATTSPSELKFLPVSPNSTLEICYHLTVSPEESRLKNVNLISAQIGFIWGIRCSKLLPCLWGTVKVASRLGRSIRRHDEARGLSTVHKVVLSGRVNYEHFIVSWKKHTDIISECCQEGRVIFNSVRCDRCAR